MEENSFGNYLYEYRAKHKLSLENLREITGVSQPYLSQLESGSKIPSRKIVERIARGVSANDEIEFEVIQNDLLKMSGYSEIKYADSLSDLFGKSKPSPNLFNSSTNSGLESQTDLNFPVNDLFFHLTDKNNKKIYKSIILNDNDKSYINKMIELYLLRKYEIKQYDRDNEIEYTDEEFSEIREIIKNKEGD